MDLLKSLFTALFTSDITSNLVAILLFFPATIGGTHIIVDSLIFAPIRQWLKSRLPDSMYQLFQCYQCTGYWVGVLCSFVLLSWNVFVAFFAGGFAGSFLAIFGGLFMNYLEGNSLVTVDTSDEEDLSDA